MPGSPDRLKKAVCKLTARFMRLNHSFILIACPKERCTICDQVRRGCNSEISSREFSVSAVSGGAVMKNFPGGASRRLRSPGYRLRISNCCKFGTLHCRGNPRSGRRSGMVGARSPRWERWTRVGNNDVKKRSSSALVIATTILKSMYNVVGRSLARLNHSFTAASLSEPGVRMTIYSVVQRRRDDIIVSLHAEQTLPNGNKNCLKVGSGSTGRLYIAIWWRMSKGRRRMDASNLLPPLSEILFI